MIRRESLNQACAILNPSSRVLLTESGDDVAARSDGDLPIVFRRISIFAGYLGLLPPIAKTNTREEKCRHLLRWAIIIGFAVLGKETIMFNSNKRATFRCFFRYLLSLCDQNWKIRFETVRNCGYRRNVDSTVADLPCEFVCMRVRLSLFKWFCDRWLLPV